MALKTHQDIVLLSFAHRINSICASKLHFTYFQRMSLIRPTRFSTLRLWILGLKFRAHANYFGGMPRISAIFSAYGRIVRPINFSRRWSLGYAFHFWNLDSLSASLIILMALKIKLSYKVTPRKEHKKEKIMNRAALHKISYGLYIVTSGQDGKFNGQIGQFHVSGYVKSRNSGHQHQ